MRSYCAALLLLVGCSSSEPLPSSSKHAATAAIGGSGSTSKKPTKTTTATPPTKPTTPKQEGDLPEVVYIRMSSHEDDLTWFCTGTLIANNRVITAGHCLDGETFFDWTIIAPFVEGVPRVVATNPLRMGSNEITEDADVGLLTLAEPIELPRYASLTDVSDDVENVTARAVVRSAEEPEAPFETKDVDALRSAVDIGYTHGYQSDRFSAGGDSGAGIFRVEDGELTHELIALERDPDGEIDFQTRIDADVIAWLVSHGVQR